MRHILILLSILLLSYPLFGQSERPETIIIPVSSLGDVSEVRKQILQNTLEDELKTHFRLVPQQRFEEVQEKVFEELEYQEYTEDQCNMMIQEMLQVENVLITLQSLTILLKNPQSDDMHSVSLTKHLPSVKVCFIF